LYSREEFDTEHLEYSNIDPHTEEIENIFNDYMGNKVQKFSENK